MGGAEHIVGYFRHGESSYHQLEIGMRLSHLARNQRAGEWFAVVGVCLGRSKQIGGDGERMGGPENGSGSRWDAGVTGKLGATARNLCPRGPRWALSAEAAGNGNGNYSWGVFLGVWQNGNLMLSIRLSRCKHSWVLVSAAAAHHALMLDQHSGSKHSITTTLPSPSFPLLPNAVPIPAISDWP